MAQTNRLTRRGFLAGGAAVLTGSQILAAPSCTLTPEEEEGPYYIDRITSSDEKLRADITEGKPGVPLKLRVALVDSRNCAPLENAALDIWHCDALGVYSGFTAGNRDGRGGPPPFGRGPMGPPPGARQIDATRFLRGVQVTGKQGIAEFVTLYPGWYEGRAIHIHVKAHVNSHVSHTGQLFFPEDITADIARLEPYAGRLNTERTTQDHDHVFTGQHGSATILKLARLRNGSNADGFLATIALAVDPEATPAPVGGGREDGFGPPRYRGPRPAGFVAAPGAGGSVFGVASPRWHV
jgi:protocatechuate 3,4-dioxygenase beta subunit